MAKLIKLKISLEAQKTDKSRAKQLDAELNENQLQLKKLLAIQNEWTRLENILKTEQKRMDEGAIPFFDSSKITSNNYVVTLSNLRVNTF